MIKKNSYRVRVRSQWRIESLIGNIVSSVATTHDTVGGHLIFLGSQLEELRVPPPQTEFENYVMITPMV